MRSERKALGAPTEGKENVSNELTANKLENACINPIFPKRSEPERGRRERSICQGERDAGGGSQWQYMPGCNSGWV